MVPSISVPRKQFLVLRLSDMCGWLPLRGNFEIAGAITAQCAFFVNLVIRAHWGEQSH